MHFPTNIDKSSRRSLIFVVSGFILLCFLWLVVLFVWSRQTGFRDASLLNDSDTVYISQEKGKLYGSQKIGDDYYYFDPDTGYMQTGFLTVKNSTFYYDEDGKRADGLVKIHGHSYYFGKDGKMAKGFQKIKKKGKTYIYYFDKDGIMVTGDTTIAGKTYTFDKKGRLQISLNEMKAQMETLLNSYTGNNSVYFKSLKTDQVISINDTNMYPCSIIKIFVMAAVYEQIENNQLNLTECQPYLEAMIIDSDNTSYNVLVNMLGQGNSTVGADYVNSYCQQLGINKTGIYHGLVPGEGFFYGSSDNTTCPSDVAKMLELIYDHEIVTPTYCDEMIDLLSQCADTSGIVSGLSQDTKCAHKSGWADAMYLDGGIVYSEYGDYILVVFSDSTYQTVAQEISSYVADCINNLYTK